MVRPEEHTESGRTAEFSLVRVCKRTHVTTCLAGLPTFQTRNGPRPGKSPVMLVTTRWLWYRLAVRT